MALLAWVDTLAKQPVPMKPGEIKEPTNPHPGVPLFMWRWF
jgi:hypothetical protein